MSQFVTYRYAGSYRVMQFDEDVCVFRPYRRCKVASARKNRPLLPLLSPRIGVVCGGLPYLIVFVNTTPNLSASEHKGSGMITF